MHTCPECGQACYCNGDIDDIDANDPADPPACEHSCHSHDEEDDFPE
jgi:hypothetical protein